ncbi:MAG: hypothetical protein A3F12_06280 [Gammaproteobacteria bacterium RIFCSPHIGHO2_12_FULL_38_14]|nr:MAG: hypothetical protein A3F12_06280 [Gammaproteobacteria bacterium RIFCSPHIGHO2_12_FULL_38_14]
MSFFKNMNWSPIEYENASILFGEMSEEMLTRLRFFHLNPTRILDVGCGLGDGSSALQQAYPEAQVIALDLSLAMLQHTKEKHAVVSLCADVDHLPFKDHSFDLIFANFLLPWQESIVSFLKTCRRVLRPGGAFMFTAFGPDTLQEWRKEKLPFLPILIEMHDLGDCLMQVGFSGPVVERDHCTLHYQDQNKLIQELSACGMIERDTKYDVPPSLLQVTYEVILAHAFKEADSHSQQGREVKIPVSMLKR